MKAQCIYAFSKTILACVHLLLVVVVVVDVGCIIIYIYTQDEQAHEEFDACTRLERKRASTAKYIGTVNLVMMCRKAREKKTRLKFEVLNKMYFIYLFEDTPKKKTKTFKTSVSTIISEMYLFIYFCCKNK